MPIRDEVTRNKKEYESMQFHAEIMPLAESYMRSKAVAYSRKGKSMWFFKAKLEFKRIKRNSCLSDLVTLSDYTVC